MDTIEDVYTRLREKFSYGDLVWLSYNLNRNYQPIICGHQHLPTVTVKKVIFNNPATIIYWTDGSKTVVKCQNGEPFDAEKGFVMAYLKKLLGNDNTFNKEINKWVGGATND